MSEVDVYITEDEDGGKVRLTLCDAAVREVYSGGRGSCFLDLDSEAADLLATILTTRRPGTYTFYPADKDE